MDISFCHAFIVSTNIILLFIPFFLQKPCGRGAWAAQPVKCLPSAQATP